MGKNKILKLSVLLIILSGFAFKQVIIKNKAESPKYKVTFIELGSVRCIPCQKMQKVIKEVEQKYPKEVKTIFYDVWTKEGKPYADTFKIGLIPTQVFLDANGKEYYRHEGFFPFDELDEVLKQKLK